MYSNFSFGRSLGVLFVLVAVFVGGWLFGDDVIRWVSNTVDTDQTPAELVGNTSLSEEESSVAGQNEASPNEAANPNPAVQPQTSQVPASNLPLSADQKALAEKFGIDTETFVITNAMQACAKEKLGADRYEEILSGSTPGPIEAARLALCVSS